MPYDYIEEYQKQDDETIWEFRDKDAQSKIDISLTETDYANPLSLETMQAQTAKNTKVKLEPIQDLHGYDKPWVGGAGKNLLRMSIDSIKSSNTSGTWNGNVYTINNVTITLLTDLDNNIIGIKVNGTPSSNVNFVLSVYDKYLANGDYKLNGCPVGGSTSGTTFYLGFYIQGRSVYNFGNGDTNVSIDGTETTGANVFIHAHANYNCQNLIFYPMLRLSTVTDSTFEPYTNICPISGHDQIDILGVGKNILHINDGSYASGSVIVSNGLIKINGTFNSQTVNLANYVNRAELNKYIGKQLTFSKTDIKGNLEHNAPFFPGIGDWNYWHLNSNNKNTIIHNRKIDAFILYLNGTYDVEFYLQVEVNDDATDYSPYQESNNLSIDLPSTVYGGVLDLESGELVVTDVYKQFTFDTPTLKDEMNRWKVERLFNASDNVLSELINKNWAVTTNYRFLCDKLEKKLETTCIATDFSFAVYGHATYVELRLRIPDSYGTAEQVKALADSCTFTYPINPFTIYISPEHLKLLKAQNTITTSQYTQIKVTYRNGVFATLEELSDTANGIYDEISGDTTTISGDPINFTTREKQKSKSTIIDLEPIQDLHGYSKPWVGGAGKNKLKYPYGNTTKTANGVTFTDKGDGTVVVSTVSGGATADTEFVLGNYSTGTVIYLEAGNYIVNGCPSGGSSTKYYISVFKSGSQVGQDSGSGVSLNNVLTTDAFGMSIWVKSGTVITSAITFKPMIRLSTVTDATYEPYTNICPISGRSSVDIDGCGKNLCNNNSNIHLAAVNAISTNGVFGILNNCDIYYYKTSGYDYLTISCDDVTKINSNIVRVYYSNAIPTDGSSEYRVNNLIPGNSVNIDKNYKYIIFCFYWNNSSDKSLIQIEEGSSVSLYEPYTPSTDLTISFGTTVYGGRLDVEKGELVVDRGYAEFDGSNDEEWSLTGGTTNYHQFVIPITDAINSVNSICNEFQKITTSERGTKTGLVSYAPDNSHRFALTDNEILITSVENWKIYIANNPIQVVYELATPQTIQLTPQQVQLLKGINNISTTGTTITVTFKNGSVAHLDDLPDFTDFDKEKLASIDTLAITLDLLTHTLIVTQDI